MNADQAGLLVMTPDGAIRAMVGGRNYARSQFNRATQARRQPGSAFKPVVYLAGLESGMTPETMVMDAPVNINGWRPRNYNGTYQGQMTLRQALSRSINTVAVRVSERAGLGRVIDTAHRLGITATLPATPSLALGTAEISLLEMTSAYAVFANGGKGVWAYGVEEIIDRQGRSLYRRSGDGPATIVDAAAIAKLN
ncbi:MAG: penicillin-binding transpeptidase domain-containing protein, partial [Rhodospirillales bacterium]|nr:penicillin-binding transpeptidase domain-containing protein [Rhodospirillales bacterium]